MPTLLFSKKRQKAKIRLTFMGSSPKSNRQAMVVNKTLFGISAIKDFVERFFGRNEDVIDVPFEVTAIDEPFLKAFVLWIHGECNEDVFPYPIRVFVVLIQIAVDAVCREIGEGGILGFSKRVIVVPQFREIFRQRILKIALVDPSQTIQEIEDVLISLGFLLPIVRIGQITQRVKGIYAPIHKIAIGDLPVHSFMKCTYINIKIVINCRLKSIMAKVHIFFEIRFRKLEPNPFPGLIF